MDSICFRLGINLLVQLILKAKNALCPFPKDLLRVLPENRLPKRTNQSLRLARIPSFLLQVPAVQKESLALKLFGL
jgi:hypothetical protein